MSRATAHASITSSEPLTEFAEYDGFGRRTAWEYTAISPSAPPLARIDAIRDVTGRIRSLTTEFGHPITMGSHDVDWRGYQYDRRGYLEREWTNLGPAVDTSSIVPNGHPNVGAGVDAAVDALGGSVSATPWDQERELEVGGLTGIVDNSPPTPEVLWSITQARGPGHRLSGVEVDGTQYPIAHDQAGRLTTGPIFDFVYDANHRLSVVEVSGNDVEHYLYTADGDLAAVVSRGRATSFAYDGTQMIAAFDTTVWRNGKRRSATASTSSSSTATSQHRAPSSRSQITAIRPSQRGTPRPKRSNNSLATTCTAA